MKPIERSLNRLSMITGLATCTALIGYFVIMRLFNLVQVTELRYFNFVILFAGLFYAYGHFRRSDENIPYLTGLGLGMQTTAISVVPFVAFVFVYLSYIEPGLLVTMKESSSSWFSEYITTTSLAGVTLIEGVSSGLIISYTLMQYYKSRSEKVLHDIS